MRGVPGCDPGDPELLGGNRSARMLPLLLLMTTTTMKTTETQLTRIESPYGKLKWGGRIASLRNEGSWNEQVHRLEVLRERKDYPPMIRSFHTSVM